MWEKISFPTLISVGTVVIAADIKCGEIFPTLSIATLTLSVATDIYHTCMRGKLQF